MKMQMRMQIRIGWNGVTVLHALTTECAECMRLLFLAIFFSVAAVDAAPFAKWGGIFIFRFFFAIVRSQRIIKLFKYNGEFRLGHIIFQLNAQHILIGFSIIVFFYDSQLCLKVWMAQTDQNR